MLAAFKAARARDVADTDTAELMPYGDIIDGIAYVVEPLSWRTQLLHWGPRMADCILRDSPEAVEADAANLARIRCKYMRPSCGEIGSRFD
jgi:hypothetical protein